MSSDEKVVEFPQAKKPARKRVRRSSRQLRPRTAEDIANTQTAEQLALRIWTATAAQNALSAMAALIDELIQSYLLDDDDEEVDESGLDAHKKREKEIFGEAITDALDQYPDFGSVSELSPNDPDVARDVEQLKDVLAKCAIGATKFEERFSRTSGKPRGRSGDITTQLRSATDSEASSHSLAKRWPETAHLLFAR